MRIGINALSLRKGGTFVAMAKLLSHFVQLAPGHEYHVVADETLPQIIGLNHGKVHYHHFPRAQRNYLNAGLWYLTVLPAWLKQQRIEVLFSHHCFLPFYRPARTVLLVQDAKYFYKTQHLLDSLSPRRRAVFQLKKLWLDYSVRVADHVTVQTQTMADSITEQIPSVRPRIKVIPHGPGYLEEPQHCRSARRRVSDALEVSYVALYRNYKNFEVLCRAIRILAGRGGPVRLHLTLNFDDDPAARAVIDYATAIGVADRIVNHGELEWPGVSELYQSSHVFVFPSVCESFGFPQVEAMAFGLPVVAADTSVNREICGYAASYFPANDESRLADLLQGLYRKPDELSAAAARSARRAGDFNWETAARETLGCLTNGHE